MELYKFSECATSSPSSRVNGTLLFSDKFGQEPTRILGQQGSRVVTTTAATFVQQSYVLWVKPDEQEFFKFLYNEASSRSTPSFRVSGVFCKDASDDLTDVNEATNAQEMLATVASDLSLNRSELARVLLVRRPSIYAWMRGG